MIEILKTIEFVDWIDKLKDRSASARILLRLDRLRCGNFGDFKNIGDGLSELRVTYGPGYRVYYTHQGDKIVLLLIGGDKGSQARDITKAKKILKQINEDSQND
jgi:putative addiction module killer protein